MFTDKAPKLELAWEFADFEECVSFAAFSPDGKQVAVTSLEGTIALIDASSGKVIRKLRGHSLGTQHLSWSRDGKQLASAGQDGQARVWEVETGKQISAVKGGATWVDYVIWVCDPSNTEHFDHIVTVSGKFLKLWKASTGELVRQFITNNNTISGIAWNESKRQIAITGYSSVFVFDLSKDDFVQEYFWKGSMLSIQWSSDSNWIVCGCQESCIHLWDTRTGQDLMMQGYRRKVKEIDMDSTGRFLSTGGGLECMVWDFAGEGPAGTSPLILEGHTSVITDTAFAPNSIALASSAKDGKVFIWNILAQIPELAFGVAVRPDAESSNNNNTNANKPSKKQQDQEQEDEQGAPEDEEEEEEEENVEKTETLSAEKIAWNQDASLICVGYSDGKVVAFKVPSIPNAAVDPSQ